VLPDDIHKGLFDAVEDDDVSAAQGKEGDEEQAESGAIR
jgi:hypothetical protein